MLDFDPKYPKNPKTLGERIRKARMDHHRMVKELAERLGVVPETVINWELRNVKPTGRNSRRVQEALEMKAFEGGREKS